MTLFSTPVMCAGPAKCPQTTRESLMFLSVRLAKGAPFAVGGERSTTLWRRLDTVPELVACDADVGSIMCTLLWFEMFTLLAFANDGFCMSVALSAWAPSVACPCNSSLSVFSSVGDIFSSGVGANEEVAFEVSDAYPGTRSLLCCANSAASERDIAEGFLRAVLNWNFLGGSKELRMVWSFADRALTALGIVRWPSDTSSKEAVLRHMCAGRKRAHSLTRL